MPLRSPILAWDHDTHTPPGAIASFINSDTNRTPYTPLDPNNLLPSKKFKKILIIKFIIIIIILEKHIVIDREALESDYSKLLEDIKDFV